MKIFLTVSVNHLEIDKNQLTGFKAFSFGEIYLKYEISISDDKKYSSRQRYLAKEISLLNEDIIIIENPCYNLNDILVLIEELNKYNKQLTRIFIPSSERIRERKEQAIKEQQRWGYREGISDEEIDSNFAHFRATLQEIKDGLKNTSIEVIEA